MVSLDPRFTSILSLLTVLGFYYMVLFQGKISLLYGDTLTIFVLALWLLIFISAWGFSSRDITATAGVQSVSQLKLKMQFALLVFNTFVGIAFVALVIIGTETVMGIQPSVISEVLLMIIIGFLLIHPLIEFKILAQEGEDSSLPAEFLIEKFLENLARKVNSTTLAAILTYTVFYIIPLAIIAALLKVSFATGAILWALMFPMINLGALAGTGLGEDLLRIRLIRKEKFLTDFGALGWPSISFRDEKTGNLRYVPSFKVGGIFLVLLAIQAIVTTAIFTVNNILKTFQTVETRVATTFVILSVALVLINKGRGALKELLGVWREGGFKINVLPLFLAVFVLLGVVLSSVLELFIGVDESTQGNTVLGAIGMGEHRTILALFLALQNIVFIIAALYIFFKPPSSAESRLVREVPSFYKDHDGWVHFYENLKSERAMNEMLKQTTKATAKDLSKLPLLLRMIEDALQTDSKEINVTASKAIYLIVKNVKNLDTEIYPTLKKAMRSGFTGAQIYAMRAIQYYADGLKTEEVLDVVDDLLETFSEEDVSVRWEAMQTLRKILKEKIDLTGYILSKLIQRLADDDTKDEDSIIQFLNKASKDNAQLGQMAISTLTVQLSSQEVKNFDAIILAIRQVVRARPELGKELDAVLRSELSSSSEVHRANAVKILSTLLEYRYGNVDAIANLIIASIHDDSTMVRDVVIESLTKSVHNIPEKVPLIFDEVKMIYSDYEKKEKIYPLLEKMAEIDSSIASDTYKLISQKIENSQSLISLFGRLCKGVEEKERDEIIDYLEDQLDHPDIKIQGEVLDALAYFVRDVPEFAGRVYGMLKLAMKHLPEQLKYQSLSLLSSVVLIKRDNTKELFEYAKKEIKNEDWRVRSVAFEAMIRCLRTDRSLGHHITEVLEVALHDIEPNVRLEVVNYISELLTQRSDITEEIIEIAKDLLKSKEKALHSTALLLFNSIAEVRPRYSNEILSQIKDSYEEEDPYARAAVIQVLRMCLEKASRINDDVLSANVTGAQKGANNSSIGIRRSAYEAITLVAELLPDTKHAVRCRKAIDKALKGHEKDPSLLEFLEECRVRALPPRVIR